MMYPIAIPREPTYITIHYHQVDPGHTKYEGMYKSVNMKDFQGNQERACAAHDGTTQSQLKQLILEKVSHL